VVLAIELSKPDRFKQREENMNTQAHTSAALGTTGERTSSQALASLMLAAGVSTLVVLADQLMESWAERHEIASWLVLWGIAVLAIVLLRGFTRLLARKAMIGLDHWSAGVAQRRADERLLSMAKTDPRLMADLQAALDRHGMGPAKDVVDLTQRRVARILRDRLYYI
jgi:hypothetical protein